VIKDDINGILAPAADTERLAKAILDLITNPQKRESMGKKGRSRF
jgi:glycosyltransferase involved in cell wall biosynthesis